MSELKRKRKPSSYKVVVKRPFNAIGKQRGKGEQTLNQEEYEFAQSHDCLESGV